MTDIKTTLRGNHQKKEEVKPYKIYNSEVFSIKSDIIGKEYKIYVKLPKSYKKSDKSYPILMLTDANYSFPLVSSIYRRLSSKVDPFIIIGISYAKGEHFGTSRTRDYTPTYSPNEPNGYTKESRLSSGQADKFIDFMTNQLMVTLQNKYRIDASKKVFAGHSLGGLLANYMVVSKPESFDYYLSGSPSLWYHDKSILEIEEKYSKTVSDIKANLFMCIGGKEETQGEYKMISDMYEFQKKLLSRNYKSLNIKSVVVDDEDHETVYPSFITKGIIMAFGKGF